MMRSFLLAIFLPGCTLLTGYLQPISCGDGLVSPQNGEECDNGDDNSSAPNACRIDCAAPACGDGVLDTILTLDFDDDGVPDTAESCDDGNNIDNDSCDNTCQPP